MGTFIASLGLILRHSSAKAGNSPLTPSNGSCSADVRFSGEFLV